MQTEKVWFFTPLRFFLTHLFPSLLLAAIKE